MWPSTETHADESRTWLFSVFVGRTLMLLLYLGVLTLLFGAAIFVFQHLLPAWDQPTLTFDQVWALLLVPLLVLKVLWAGVRAKYNGWG